MGLKEICLIAGTTLSAASVGLMAATNFTPEFVVASIGNDPDCVIGRVGPVTSEWEPSCSPVYSSTEAFESETSEYWPLFPVQHLATSSGGELPDVDSCEALVPIIEGAVDLQVAAGVAAAITELEEGFGQPIAAVDVVLASVLNTTDISALGQGVGGLTYQLTGQIYAAAAGNLTATQSFYAAGAKITELVGQGVDNCYCAAGQGIVSNVTYAVFLGNAAGAFENIDDATSNIFSEAEFDELDFSAAIPTSPCADDTTYTPLFDFQACGLAQGPLVKAATLNSVFNNVYGTRDASGAFVGQVTEEEYLEECNNDIEDLEKIESAKTMLYVAIGVGSAGVLAAVAASATKSKPVTIVAAVLVLAAGGATLFGLLEVRSAPVYENVGAECPETAFSICYSSGLGFYTGLASIGTPVLAAICLLVSTCMSATEPDYEDETALISDKA